MDIILDKDAILNTDPHYTDERFRNAQTVFGQKEDGLEYNYSDRFWEWNYDKALEALKKATGSGAKPKTCRWYEQFLSAYFDKPIEIKHIEAGWNWSNGYPYQVFGYREKTT